MHPKYITVIDMYHREIFSHVSIKVLKTGREYCLYDHMAIRFIKNYRWDML